MKFEKFLKMTAGRGVIFNDHHFAAKINERK